MKKRNSGIKIYRDRKGQKGYRGISMWIFQSAAVWFLAAAWWNAILSVFPIETGGGMVYLWLAVLTAGLVLLCAVWGAGVLGIVLNAVSLERFKAVSMVCYIAMGWAVVFAMGTVLEKMPAAGLWFLLAGGIAYTVGVAAYGFGKKIPYMHAVWHLFVLLGSVLHTAAVYTIVV